MGRNRSSVCRAAIDIFYRKVGAALLPVSLALLLFGVTGCRSPAAKNVSQTLVSNCTVTPAILKANTCVNFQKGLQSQCFLRLHDYTATDETLKAAEGDLNRIVGRDALIDKNVKKMENLLAPIETRSLSYYTASGYNPMNNALRGAEQLMSSHENIIYAAASGLNKLKKFEGMVYRTERLNIAKLDSIQQTFKVGNIVLEEVFLSTTSRADFSYISPASGIHISYSIQSKTGRSIKPVAVLEYEDEVLFAPGSAFRVLAFSQEVKEVVPQFERSTRSSPVFSTNLKIKLEEIDPAG